MIIELKSLLPLTYSAPQEEEENAVSPAQFSLTEGALRSLSGTVPPLAASDQSIADSNFSPAQFEFYPPEILQESSPEYQEDNSRITDLLEQLLTVSERNAESSNRIADLLEQQNSDSSILYS